MVEYSVFVWGVGGIEKYAAGMLAAVADTCPRIAPVVGLLTLLPVTARLQATR